MNCPNTMPPWELSYVIMTALRQQSFRVDPLERKIDQQNDLAIRPTRRNEPEDSEGWREDDKGPVCVAKCFTKQKNVPVEIQINFNGTPMGMMTDTCDMYLFWHIDSGTISWHPRADLLAAMAANQLKIAKRGSYTVVLVP